jgi:orotate phosphoribosyltransferase
VESGHHSALWLDLDPLFADPNRITPFANDLAGRIRPYDVSLICGPLRGGAFLAQLVAHELDVEFCFTERVMPDERHGLYHARYRLPSAFVSRVNGKRVAMVDDVISAGSALRGTLAELESHGATPVVAGALLALGTVGTTYFMERHVAVESTANDAYELWTPEDCPLCAEGEPLETVAD